jgi:uncharacterized protein YqeY
MPELLTDNEIEELIKKAIQATGASSMQDMGKVITVLKSQLRGRADMGKVSNKVKELLAK